MCNITFRFTIKLNTYNYTLIQMNIFIFCFAYKVNFFKSIAVLVNSNKDDK